MNTIDALGRSSPSELRRVPSLGRRLGAVLFAGIARFDRMMERRRSRLALLELTDDQLKDIGLSHADAHREGVRPFWD